MRFFGNSNIVLFLNLYYIVLRVAIIEKIDSNLGNKDISKDIFLNYKFSFLN